MDKPTLIVVTGPTASGKTGLAIELARRLGTEVISADSRQVYRGMPVTTAVPTAAERAMVPHHLVEILDVPDNYSAARFADDAMAILPRLFDKSGCAVVCGGSMMYIDALVKGIDDMPTVTPEVRTRVQEMLNDHGQEGLLAMLQIYDPDYYAVVDRANTKRVMHALELCLQSGRPYSHFRRGYSVDRPWRTVALTIGHDRAALFDRINRRVDAMVAAGMEDEARALYPLRFTAPLPPGMPLEQALANPGMLTNSLNTVGFKEWFAYFDGFMDRPTAIARIAKNTRVYAKKQLTWLSRPGALPHTVLDPAADIVEQALRVVADFTKNITD